MMTVHKIGGEDASGYATYLAGEPTASRRGDYYLGPEGSCSSAPGRWHGRGAEALDLDGTVTRADLITTWEGRDLKSGEIAVKRAAHGEHVAAVDCTFSAPKSVSILWATTGDSRLRDAIEAAQTEAVSVAMDHIEKTAPLLRQRVDGQIVHTQTAGIIAAVFRHHTSRLSQTETGPNAIPDPQLHDHIAIANMALRPDNSPGDGAQWGAIDSRELYRIAAEAGAVYRSELANSLQQLGYSVERQGRYFEVVGVSERIRNAFSTRTHDIENARREFIHKYGRAPTDAEAKALTVRTRAAKSPEPVNPFPAWQQRAQSLEFDVESVPRLGAERDGENDWNSIVAAVVAELTDPQNGQSLTRQAAVFDTRQLRIAVAEAAQGYISGRDIPALIEDVSASPELMQLDERHWTTRTMRDAEREVLERARTLSRTATPQPSNIAVNRAIANASVTLSDEQIAAVRGLTNRGGFHLLSAPAGSGKGEVLSAVATAHRESGHRVIALAAAGETAVRLQEQIGADRSWTIDGYILGVNSGHIRPAPNDVVLVDEGALVETMRWRDLLRATGDSTVISAGDAQQLPSIEAGGIWNVLEREVGVQRLAGNHRAHEQWAADAWSALRDGRSPEALAEFQKRGQILVADTRVQARNEAVELWDRLRHQPTIDGNSPSTLLLTDGSNREVDDLNRAAQERRLENSELGDQFVTVIASHRSGTSRREEQLHRGDEVVLQRRVADIEGNTLARNGTTGRIAGVDEASKRIDVELSSGTSLSLEGEDIAAVRLGYARHVYSAQGTTVDRAVVVTGGWQTGRESSYVGVSRAREESYVVTDLSSLGLGETDREDAISTLAERMGESHAKSASLEFTAHQGDRETDAADASPQMARGGQLTPEEQYAELVASAHARSPGRQEMETADSQRGYDHQREERESDRGRER
jgi:conjugative relaxase-like TrwC/TraI family protein